MRMPEGASTAIPADPQRVGFAAVPPAVRSGLLTADFAIDEPIKPAVHAFAAGGEPAQRYQAKTCSRPF
ncbi:hypothetical protein BRAS3843_330003 [Bradyrhizobium sp. STM 3843]|nr:hypothetical protein BRAS3843_330003 [Bradyrhizobium sp. STM 3843]